jgi:SagB-type dehydrogenase family enzyme
MPDDIPAFDVAAALAYDAAEPLAGATYVKFVSGLVTVRSEQGLVVAGGVSRRVIVGDDTVDAVARLVPLLDGARTLDEVICSSGLTHDVARRVISLLSVSDLLEYGELPLRQETGRCTATASARHFLARTLHSTARYRNAGEMQSALACASALVLAQPYIGEQIRSDLTGCGVGNVGVLELTDEDLGTALSGLCDSPCSLVVAVDDGQNEEALARAETLCREGGVPMLRTARCNSSIEVGPIFYTGSTACYECFTRSRGESAEPGLSEQGCSALDDCLAAMASDEALAVLGHVRTPTAFRTVTIASLADFSERTLMLLPYPECAVCGALFSSSSPSDDAAAFEFSLRSLPRRLGGDRVSKSLFSPAIRDLVTERTRLTGHPEVPLPPAVVVPSRDAPPPARTGPPLNASSVAALLSAAGGFKSASSDPDPLRWAPSGGNLASARIYAVAFGVDLGLGTGVPSLYDDLNHSLVAVHSRAISAAGFLDWAGLAVSEPSVLLVFVADVERISRKYRTFSYRLAHLDSGVAAAQLTVVAPSLALEVAFASGWTDDVSGLLDLLPGREFVTALAIVTPPGGNPCP